MTTVLQLLYFGKKKKIRLLYSKTTFSLLGKLIIVFKERHYGSKKKKSAFIQKGFPSPAPIPPAKYLVTILKKCIKTNKQQKNNNLIG